MTNYLQSHVRRNLGFVLALGLAFVIGGSLFLPTAYAQTDHFVILSQPSSATSTAFLPRLQSRVWEIRIGNGWNASTTGAFIAPSLTVATPNQWGQVKIDGYSDASYTSNVSSCVYDSQLTPTGTYSATSSNPFVQFHYYTGSGCVLNPAIFYDVTIEIDVDNPNTPIAISGSETWTPPSGWQIVQQPFAPFFPQFAIVQDNFNLTPTAGDSSISLSGASSFCSSIASTTSLTGTFVYALCYIPAFLFIPPQSSLTNFSNVGDALKTKIPFSDFYVLKNILLSEFQATSSSKFPDVVLDFSQSTTTSCTGILSAQCFPAITLLSTSTVRHYISDSMWNVIQTFMQVVIVVEGALFLYHDIRRRSFGSKSS